MEPFNGRKRIVSGACVVAAALILGAITGGLTTWRNQGGLVIRVAHAQEKADKCCTTSEANTTAIAVMQGDVAHTKDQVDEARNDIKRMDTNLIRLLDKMRVEPVTEPTE